MEWPTLLLAVAIHGLWLLVTLRHAAVPPWLLPVVGGWLVAWHGSLQHELIHGHPTRWRAANTLLGSLPLALWLPYPIYRRTHVAHHATEAVTDPSHDPESRYGAHDAGWADRAQASLAGRLLLGPAIGIARFWRDEARRLRTEPGPVARDWLPHLAGAALVIGWLHWVGMGIGVYLIAFVYPGAALSLLRSFAEHRADPTPGHRVAVVERAGPFAWLFLHNNLHAAHHRAPGVPWYRLPAYYRRHRAAVLAENGGLLYRGYGEVARRFLFRPHDRLVHPDHAIAR